MFPAFLSRPPDGWTLRGDSPPLIRHLQRVLGQVPDQNRGNMHVVIRCVCSFAAFLRIFHRRLTSQQTDFGRSSTRRSWGPAGDASGAFARDLHQLDVLAVLCLSVQRGIMLPLSDGLYQKHPYGHSQPVRLFPSPWRWPPGHLRVTFDSRCPSSRGLG